MTIKLFTHCENAYAHMDSKAEVGGEAGKKYVYVKGIDLVTRVLGLSQSYYGQIFNTLKEMGCIEQMERGGGGKDSLYLLHYPPNLEDFMRVKNSGKIGGVGGNPQYVAENLNQLRNRMTAVEADIAMLKQVVQAFSQTYSSLAEKVEKLEANYAERP